VPLAAWLLSIAGSYLLGSVSFAVVISRLFGLADPRSYGSGNPGATNVLRSGSKAAAALTLLGDAQRRGGCVAGAGVRAAVRVGEFGVALGGAGRFRWPPLSGLLRFKGGKGSPPSSVHCWRWTSAPGCCPARHGWPLRLSSATRRCRRCAPRPSPRSPCCG